MSPLGSPAIDVQHIRGRETDIMYGKVKDLF
jgi:hypothetical protein